MKGASIPENPESLRVEFAQWLQNHTARRLLMAENERRLRASMYAQRLLMQSDQEVDRRQASALARWHLEHWQIADVPGWAIAGQDQPFELQLRAAMRRKFR